MCNKRARHFVDNLAKVIRDNIADRDNNPELLVPNFPLAITPSHRVPRPFTFGRIPG